MKNFFKEVTILLFQLFVFYILPLFMNYIDPIGIVLLMIILTFLLSFIIGVISRNKIKYGYPLVIVLLFFPTIWIYYNESAFIHIIWYLVISFSGLVIGDIINRLLYKTNNTNL